MKLTPVSAAVARRLNPCSSQARNLLGHVCGIDFIETAIADELRGLVGTLRKIGVVQGFGDHTLVYRPLPGQVAAAGPTKIVERLLEAVPLSFSWRFSKPGALRFMASMLT